MSPVTLGRTFCGKVLVDREIETVAELEIVLPLAVGAKIREARLDLDDGERAFGRQRHEVGAAAVGKRELGDGAVPELQE